MTGRLRPTDLPDPALGFGIRLLEPGIAHELLAASLEGRGIGTPRPLSLWYKPGRRLIVRYDVKVDGRARHAALWLERAREVQALWFPDDPLLVGLSGPGGLGATLLAGGLEPGGRGDPATIAWKPRARAVVRSGPDLVKMYGDHRHYAAAAAALILINAGLTTDTVVPFATPDFRALVPERRATVQEFLPGEMARTDADARLVGDLLRRLHDWTRPGLDRVSPPTLLKRAAESAAVVIAVFPALADEVSALLGRLEADMPRDVELTLSHGDFEAGQVIVGPSLPRSGAIVDVDDLCLAPPAFDIANYVVHAVRRAGDLDRVGTVLDDFLVGYGSRPPAMDWHLAVSALIRAPAPFRKLQPHWQEGMAALVRVGCPFLEGRWAA